MSWRAYVDESEPAQRSGAGVYLLAALVIEEQNEAAAREMALGLRLNGLPVVSSEKPSLHAVCAGSAVFDQGLPYAVRSDWGAPSTWANTQNVGNSPFTTGRPTSVLHADCPPGGRHGRRMSGARVRGQALT